MSKEYDVLVIGPVSLDHNIDYLGNERKEVGGAVVASGFAAAKSGYKTALFTKLNSNDVDLKERFANSGADLFWSESKSTCSIRNQYLTADKEKRLCTSMGVCDNFKFEEFANIKTKIYHFAGLVYGDFDGSLFKEASKFGKVAVDVQCLLRHVEDDKTMAFHDWADKKEFLPYIDYLKTDAAEAEILTGSTDRREAAKLLYSWGAKEILITHNTEVLAYDGKDFYTCPIKSRNLSGRTGRGDTTFAGYINERQNNNIEDSLLYCTALVSLKMETPGPFMGVRQDVLDYINEFYHIGD
jgi:sugar/nucleoside kinase (ribokinase family)